MSNTLYKYYTTIKNCKTLEILEEVFKTIKENEDMLKIEFNMLEDIYKNEVNELISQDKKKKKKIIKRKPETVEERQHRYDTQLAGCKCPY